MSRFEGSMVALATPFRGGRLDEDAFRKLIEYQLANGTAGLIPMGTTGEAATMTAEERRRAIELTVQTAKGRALVIAGAGSFSTQDTIESAKQARDVGADAVLVVTPYYNRPTQAGLVEHYRAIAKAHPGLPIVAYNVPGRTGVDMTAESLARLCEVPEVVAVKEATASMIRALEIRELCGDRMVVLSGDDFTVAPLLACGGKGVISVSANVAPRMMADLVKAGLTGDTKTALALQLKLSVLHRLLFVESSPTPIKWAMHLLGMFGPEVRLPLLPMTEGNAAKLKAELTHLGLVS